MLQYLFIYRRYFNFVHLVSIYVNPYITLKFVQHQTFLETRKVENNEIASYELRSTLIC